MGKKSRTKGSAGELEVCKLIEEIFPDAARELEQYQASLGRDLRNTQPLCVQVKRHKTISHGVVANAYDEADLASDSEYKFPVVFYREDRKNWRTAFTLADMLDMLDTESDLHDLDLMLDMDSGQFLAWYRRELNDDGAR